MGRWLVAGWHIAIAYVIGFFIMPALLGWHPDAPHKKKAEIEPNRPAYAMVNPR